MKIRKWKARRLPYKPMSYTRIRSYQDDVQTHAQLRCAWIWDKEAKDYVKQITGCQCGACNATLRLLARLNPAKFDKLVNPPKPDAMFFKTKKLTAKVYFSRNRGKSLNRFAIL